MTLMGLSPMFFFVKPFSILSFKKLSRGSQLSPVWPRSRTISEPVKSHGVFGVPDLSRNTSVTLGLYHIFIVHVFTSHGPFNGKFDKIPHRRAVVCPNPAFANMI